jgi:polysaccharide export outer membrane protein
MLRLPAHFRRRAAALLAAIAAAVLGALAAPVPADAQPRPQAPVVSPDYRLGAQDRLRVEVFEVPELNTDARVAEDGSVTLPVIGAVPARGLTADELADAIESRLEATYVNRATVRVELTEVLSKTVTVLGAVARPGTLGHPGQWTLLEAITAAGGLAAEHGERVHVQRRAANGLTDQVSIPVDTLVGRMDPKVNLPVLPDDVINVERIRKVTIYLLGEVATAGAMQFESSDPVTLLTVIARAGGLSERASPRLRVKRKGEDGRLVEIEAHYGRILDGKDPDMELRDGDILVVKESFF